METLQSYVNPSFHKIHHALFLLQNKNLISYWNKKIFVAQLIHFQSKDKIGSIDSILWENNKFKESNILCGNLKMKEWDTMRMKAWKEYPEEWNTFMADFSLTMMYNLTVSFWIVRKYSEFLRTVRDNAKIWKKGNKRDKTKKKNDILLFILSLNK